LSAGLAALSGHFRAQLPLPAGLFRALSVLFSFAAIAVLIAVIFKYVPDVRLRWRDASNRAKPCSSARPRLGAS
jgi:uncharacterized BrkB/YihY/UPF0761 family membrane protein